MSADIFTLIKTNSREAMNSLLSSQPNDLNKQDRFGLTPICIAAAYNHVDIVQDLIKKGANLNITTKDGQTPLYLACARNYSAIVTLLIAAGANVNIAENNNETPLYNAAGNNHREIFLALLRAQAEVNIACHDGKFPLLIASENNCKLIVKDLIKDGRATIDMTDHNKRTALHAAAEFNHIEPLRDLIKAGAAINSKTVDGKTPLFIAVENNRITIVKELLKAGANKKIASKSGKTPVMVAESKKYQDIVALLKPASSQKGDGKVTMKNNGIDLNESGQLDMSDLGASIKNNNARNNSSSNEDLESMLEEIAYIKNNRTTKKWNRSKIMLVGEGRAGKTALANSIIGNSYQPTPSTIGINQLSCAVSHTNVNRDGDSGDWQLSEKAERELETALAMMIMESRKKKEISASSTLPNSNNQTNSTEPMQTTISSLDNSVSLSKDDFLTPSSPSPSPSPLRLIPSQSALSNSLTITTLPPVLAAAAAPSPTPTPMKIKEIDDNFVLKCLSANIQSSSSSSDLYLSIFDFGGQSVFDVIHHLFLTPYGIYLLVFNMRWMATSATLDDRESCLSRLKAWLNSIVMHTIDQDRSSGANDGNQIMGPPAPIVFVGTNKDIITSSAEHKKISESLRQAFGDTLAWQHIIKNDTDSLCFFPVNNLLGRQDPTVGRLLASIEHSLSIAEYVNREIPLAWLQILDKLKATENSHLSLQEFKQLLTSCDINIECTFEVLSFFNKMGELLWIDENGLRDVVILNPISFFVTPASLVICKHVESSERNESFKHETALHIECQNTYPQEWDVLLTKGLVSSNILMKLLGTHHEEIILLMIQFGLIVPIIHDDDDDDEDKSHTTTMEFHTPSLYIVPTLLSDTEICHMTPSSLSSSSPNNIPTQTSLYFFFHISPLSKRKMYTVSDIMTKGFMPEGLFQRLLGKLLSWSQLTTTGVDLTTQGISKNDAQLRFGNQIFRLQSMQNLQVLYLNILRSNNPYVLIQRLLEMIRKVLDECFGILKVSEFIRYIDNTTTTTHKDYFIPCHMIHEALDYGRILVFPDNDELAVEHIRSMYSPLLCNDHYKSRQEFDVFLSYRWNYFDQRFVTSLHDTLQQDDCIRIFLDHKIIEEGNNIQTIFVESLLHTKVFVAIYSLDAMTKMKTHDDSVEDNVLIEWIIALECQRSHRRNIRILPIRYDSINEITGFIDFTWNVIQELPDRTPIASLRKAELLLKENNILPGPAFHQLTVRNIVSEIGKNLCNVKVTDCKSMRQLIRQCGRTIFSLVRNYSIATTTMSSIATTAKGAQVISNSYGGLDANQVVANGNADNKIGDDSSKGRQLTSSEVQEAWDILNDPFRIKTDSIESLRSLLDEIGAARPMDLIHCEDNELITLSNALKALPKRAFLKALKLQAT